MMMRLRTLVAVAALAAACQSSAPPAPAPTASTPDLATLRARGDTHLALGEYEAAATAYREAVALDGANQGLRHRLGVALARLGRLDEAAEAFRWVVDNGGGGSEEVRIARQWLAERDAAAKGDARRPERPVFEKTADPAAARDAGRVEGRTEWADLDPALVRPILQVVLEGDAPDTKGRRYAARTSLGDPYSVADVPPGRYKLMAQVGPIRLWETRVDVKPGGPTAVDLLPATSIAPKDALKIK
jgi:tetratricopeptide (TPR) repeat protein